MALGFSYHHKIPICTYSFHLRGTTAFQGLGLKGSISRGMRRCRGFKVLDLGLRVLGG